MRIASFTSNMNRLRSARRTALLASTHWDDVRLAAPGLADPHRPELRLTDPLQLEITMRPGSQRADPLVLETRA